MLDAFLLSLGQLLDRRVVSLILRVVGITLALFLAAGVGLFFFLRWLLPQLGLGESGFAAAAAAVLIAAGSGVLLFRVVAVMVLGVFADEMVEAVELKHYPARAEGAREVGNVEGFKLGLKSARRAIGYNLLALPAYIFLGITGFGSAIAFFLVNGLVLGRDLEEMVLCRHLNQPEVANLKIGGKQRLALGVIATLLLAIPGINLLAPLVSAGMATHLMHRAETQA